MKKIICLLAMILVTSKGLLAQNLTADELIKQTYCTSFECFNEYVITKGYSYELAKVEDNFKYYLFSADKYFEDGDIRTKNSVLFVIPDSKAFISVGCRTADKRYYLQLLNNFKAKGFASQKTENRGQKIVTNYKLKKYSLIVLVEKLEKDGRSWTSYDFELSRNI